ncbi:MAG: prephenate dehydrogenase [Clostridia bacterium]|nr:prephenate dehydrogenase [Clostridia bacterium]
MNGLKKISKIGIVGLGLMGGSFGRVLVKRGYTVYAADLSESAMLQGELMNAFTAPLDENTAKSIDILVVAVNPTAFESAAERFLPYLKNGAIVCDFCGIKRYVVNVMQRLSETYPDLTFIGGHPMAGREYSGVEHSSITLFEKASMIFVPVKADVFALDAIKTFFISAGFSRAVITDADFHDGVIAYTSQLCHIVSNAFILNAQADNRSGYSAGSFKDLTRVAKMNPAMWTELITLNRDKALKELDEFMNNLSEYRAAIAEGNEEKLSALFAAGNERKIRIESEKDKNV